MHNTGAIWGDGNNDATVLPGFMLDYHPSDKFQMSIMVQRVAYGAGLPYSNWSPSGRFAPYFTR
jgi:hypothetical protein